MESAPVSVTPGNQTSENKFAVWAGVITSTVLSAAMGLYAVFPSSLYLGIVVALVTPIAAHFGVKTVHNNRTTLKIAALKADTDRASIAAGLPPPIPAMNSSYPPTLMPPQEKP